MILVAVPVASNILMPHSFFATRSEALENPQAYSGPQESNRDAQFSDPNGSADDIKNANNFQTEHARNCFFTPVQCMLPLTDSHKDVQSLHGVYSPTAPHVRRSVDTMLTSPWGYTDLIKRGGDNRFYQWLSRF
uniref:Secreted protein n=1 Tax=Caenorhabditis tropicalis TaxID=1561998 RepID=A0A1I7TNF2_9PELO